MANKVKTTKAKLVTQHLIEKKEITSLDAIKLYAATRLSAIIFNLRQKGYAITTIPVKNAYNFDGNIPLFAKTAKIINGIQIITIVFINFE